MRRSDPRPRMLAAAAWALGALALLGGAPAPRAEALTRDLDFPGLQITRDDSGAWSVLTLPGANVDVDPGQPMVPSVKLTIELPAGMRASAASVEIIEQEPLALPAPILRFAGEEAIDREPAPLPASEPVSYAADQFYPPQWVEIVSTLELTTGSRYAVLRVNPVRMWPASDRLLWVKSARLTLELEPGDPSAASLLRKRALAVLAAPSPSSKVLLLEPGLNPSPTPSVEGSPVEYVILCPPDQAIVDAWAPLAKWQTDIGHPARIITTDWIEENYPTGADLPERVRLFLRDAYVHWGLRWALIGCDADKIPVRYAFSRAYGNGIEVHGGAGTLVATDYYYACLEGNWDADGDGIFAEASIPNSDAQGDTLRWRDWADTTPEIHVGRVSARSAAEIRDFLDKYFAYVRTPSTDGYLDRYLLLGEVLFNAQWSLSGLGDRADCSEIECHQSICRGTDHEICVTLDGAEDCMKLYDLLGDSLGLPLQHGMLLERAEYWKEARPDIDPEPTLESSLSVIAQMNAGYGFVHHIGHGDRDRWAVGNGRLLAGDLSSLTNGTAGHFFWTYASNCYSAAVDYDCIGERMVNLPGQGAVAYMGCTNADFPGVAWKFAKDFYELAYTEDGRTIGDGFFGSLAANNVPSTQDNTTRFLLFGQLLIGDPAMVVWRGTPSQATVQLVGYANKQVPLGVSPLVVSVTHSGAPVPGARVCVHKLDEVYAVVETDAQGEAEVPFRPQTTGEFTVSVVAPAFTPVLIEDAQVINAQTGTALVVDDVGVVDDGSLGSDGNANGAIEVGEQITLSLALANKGVAGATNVTARLRVGADVPAGAVTITDSSATFASIPTGGSPVTVTDAFALAFEAKPPAALFGDADSRRLPFVLALRQGEVEARYDLYLDVTRPRLAVATNRLVGGSGYQAEFWLGIENRGKGAASRMTLSLTSFDAFKISVEGGTSSTRAIRDIAPGDTALIGPFDLVVHDDLGRMRAEVVANFGDADTLHARELDLRGPSAPTALTLVGLPQAMKIDWTAPTDAGADGIFGYQLYRSPGGSSVFEPVFDGILEGHRFFEDDGLGQLAKYNYYVAAVDSGGNAGTSSASSTAYTSPGMRAGWPNLVDTYTESSPLICELDGWASTGWGREVIFGGETIYAFHSDGSEVVDGDNLERTRGPFSSSGNGHVGLDFWGKAAAGDIDADGEVELVAMAFNRTNDPANYPDARGEIVCWGPWGETPEWVYTMPKCVAWGSPTLADLNGDGRLEVIFCAGISNHAGVYILDSAGQPYPGTQADGLLRDLGGKNLYQHPSVGDVDNNGSPDITVATRTEDVAKGAIHVLKPDGNYVPGFSGDAGAGLTFRELGLSQSTTGSATLCNLNGTLGDEILIVTPARLWCITRNSVPDAVLAWSFIFPRAYTSTYGVLPEPALGDINRDGFVDVAFVDASSKLHVLRGATGAESQPFPVQLETGFYYGSCILANVDEGPEPEIVFGDNKQRIHAYTYQGQIARGFPIHFAGNLMHQSLAAWDLDEDGFQNLVVQANKTQVLTVYDLTNSAFPEDETEQARQNPWPMRYRDPYNSGRYSLVPPVAVRILAEAPGVSADGEVTLAWETAEPVASFRIRRTASADGPAALIGEVPGQPDAVTHRYTYADRPPEAGRFIYHINPVTLAGEEETGAIVMALVDRTRPAHFGFDRVGPDPLTPGRVASIAFGLAGTGSTASRAQLAVYDLQGRRVAALLDEARVPGSHAITWDGRDEAGRPVATGLYLLRLESGARVATKRLLVVR
jgi:hypothetical protein